MPNCDEDGYETTLRVSHVTVTGGNPEVHGDRHGEY